MLAVLLASVLWGQRSHCLLALTGLGHRDRLRTMSGDVHFSPGSALWVLLAIVVLGSLAAWFWVARSRKSRGPSARPAVFSLFADVTEMALPSGWSDEQIVAVVGDGPA
jgi:hypothetical protein